MKDRTTLSQIRQFAARASEDDFFLGRAMAEFKASHGMSDAQLAAHLHCETDALVALALCRMPNAQGEYFQRDIHRMADFAKCDADKLIRLLREIISLRALRQACVTDVPDSGLLAAARDYSQKDEDEQRQAKSPDTQDPKSSS